MLKISERKQLLRDLELAVFLADDNDDHEEAEEFMALYAFISSSPFIDDRTRRHRDDHFFVETFPTLNDDEFRSIFRTTRQGFAALVRQLEDHLVFSNNSRCAQLHPAWQIAIALARFGGAENGSSVMVNRYLLVLQ
ncbi:hypothetical protein BC939DRAFT_506534 [Gamsiella multidivaricata]|uniref:uncharacterized protein n=1 Tax=Gamsiella multidivaricata TaxID=101098 RepID=UPI00221E5B05|nr:uncharacterized protein BC939DRAFT_506534 [Gamsiella multidivaricata]KAI7818459.1 hypothetical protein BC939DRAFT_506534 [Gamsiella multidivaricata]